MPRARNLSRNKPLVNWRIVIMVGIRATATFLSVQTFNAGAYGILRSGL